MKKLFQSASKPILLSSLIIYFLCSCEKKLNIEENVDLPEIVWTVPDGWKAVATGQKLVPWFIHEGSGRKISIMHYEQAQNAIWELAKVWRRKLNLPILSPKELTESLDLLESGAVFLKVENDETVVLAAILALNSSIWVAHVELVQKEHESFEPMFKEFAESMQANPELDLRIRQLKESDDIRAHMELANYFHSGKGVEKSLKEVKKYLSQAHKKGSVEAGYRLALLALQQDQTEIGIELLSEGVKKKDINSIKKLAGLVLEKNSDYEFAKQLLLMASELGDTESMFYLGTIYLDTSPIKDRAHVLKWIKMAASKKYAPAIRTLGIFYSNGYGVSKDSVKAIELLQQAVNMKDVAAAELLADIYMQGELTDRDPLKAVQNLLKAIAGGSSRAMVVLANLYFKGDGIEKDKDRGFKLLEQAIRKGNSDAMTMMGSLFNDGVLTQKNLDLAFKFFKMAAESGQKEGMFRLSLAYFLGKGCEKEESTGYRWLKRAAEKGHEEAKKMLKEKGR